MSRPFKVILTLGLLISLSIFGLFKIKYQVLDLQREVSDLQKQVNREKIAMQVLKAEWEYLNKPERLKSLAQKYLKLESIKVAQVKLFKDTSKDLYDTDGSFHQVTYSPIVKNDSSWHFKKDSGLKKNNSGTKVQKNIDNHVQITHESLDKTHTLSSYDKKSSLMR